MKPEAKGFHCAYCKSTDEPMQLRREIERLQRENEDYLRMLKMSGQNIGLRLLDAEEKIARLESMLDRLASMEKFPGIDPERKDWAARDRIEMKRYAASHREKDDG